MGVAWKRHRQTWHTWVRECVARGSVLVWLCVCVCGAADFDAESTATLKDIQRKVERMITDALDTVNRRLATNEVRHAMVGVNWQRRVPCMDMPCRLLLSLL